MAAATAITLCGCSKPAANMVSRDLALSVSHDRAAAEPPAAQPPPAESVSITEPDGDLALGTALALALLHNPAFRSDALEVRIAEAERLQASLRPNPELIFEAEEIGAGAESTDPAELTIALGQVIELGDKRKKRTHLADIQAQLAAIDTEARRLDILTEVHSRFVDLLAAQHQVELAHQLEDLAEATVRAVSTLVEAGKTSPLEETRAKIRLSNVRTQSKQTLQNLQTARYALAALWAAPTPRFEKAVGAFETTAPLASAEDLIRRLDNNPDLARWGVAIEQRRAALQLERAKAVPDLNLAGGVQLLEGETAGVFGLGLPLPVYDKNQGGRLAAAHRLEQAGLEAQAAEIRLRTLLRTAHGKAANALTRIEELRRNVLTNAESLFEAIDEGYRAGKFGYLDLLDAQSTYAEAQREYIDALTDYHLARAELERLIGDVAEPSEQTDSK